MTPHHFLHSLFSFCRFWEKGRAMFYLKSIRKSGGGFTLIELLVVIAILGIVLGAIYGTHVLNEKAFREGTITAELSQNSRIILERLTREIRQARKIVTVLPRERINSPREIMFQDGHLPLVVERSIAQGGTSNTITLSPTASSATDFYKNMFVKITGGTGINQIRKIIGYNGITKIAQIEGTWAIIPNSTSSYKIDTSYYYIHYYRDIANNVWRRIIAYYFSGNPSIYVSWNATPPVGQTLRVEVLEEPRLIGEYVVNLEFWGLPIINIFLTLEEKDKRLELQTKVFGRNL